MDFDTLAGLLGIPAAMTLFLLAWMARKVIPLIRKITQFLDDWQGEVARSGVPERLGVLASIAKIQRHQEELFDRLREVEHELHPNSGTSMRDAIDRMEKHLNKGSD